MILSPWRISIVLPLVYMFTLCAFLLLMYSFSPFISYLIGIFALHFVHSSVSSPVIFSDRLSLGVIVIMLFFSVSW